jgi:SAM-dependent methyltransferase
MATATEFDSAKVEAFVGKVLGDASATMSTMLAVLGDRLGLFKDLHTSGPATSAELAARAGIQERYAREWLGGMASAGYLTFDAEQGRFQLPAEHAPALAEEAGPYFFGGLYQMVPAMVATLDTLAEAFRAGGGVPYSAYGPDFWDGMDRFTNCWFENLLLQQWIPALPDVARKLDSGARVADVGCGRGRALIKLAQAYPASQFVGYDIYPPTVERASALADAAGVGDRVRFEALDGARGLPERFDVITTFDVIHDAPDPAGLLRAIREALADDGIYVCLDINCSDRLEENAGPLGSFFHGISVMYCMTTSLAQNGAGLGTLGFHERKVRELGTEAGFRSIRRLSLENPFNSVYEIRP